MSRTARQALERTDLAPQNSNTINQAGLNTFLDTIDDFDLEFFAEQADCGFRSRSNTWPLKVPDSSSKQRFEPSYELSARIDEKDELAVAGADMPTLAADTFDTDPLASGAFAATPYDVNVYANTYATFDPNPSQLSFAFGAQPAVPATSTTHLGDVKPVPSTGNVALALSVNVHDQPQLVGYSQYRTNAASHSPLSSSPNQNASLRHVSPIQNDSETLAMRASMPGTQLSRSVANSNASSTVNVFAAANECDQSAPGIVAQLQAETLERLLNDEEIAALLSTNLNGTRHKPTRRNAWGNLSYADLITLAIETSPDKRLTLTHIYEWMTQNVPYFRDKGSQNSSAGWKNSIRHNLSLHARFMRVQNETTGKSSWWVINPEVKSQLLAQYELAAKQDAHADGDKHSPVAMVSAAPSSVTGTHRRRAQTMDPSEVEAKRNKLKRTLDARRNATQPSEVKQPHCELPLQSAVSNSGSLSSVNEQRPGGLPAAVAALKINTQSTTGAVQSFFTAPPSVAAQSSTSPLAQPLAQLTPSGSPLPPSTSTFLAAPDLNAVASSQYTAELFDSYSSPFTCDAESATFAPTSYATQAQPPSQFSASYDNTADTNYYGANVASSCQAPAQFAAVCSCSQIGASTCAAHADQSYSNVDDMFFSNSPSTNTVYATQQQVAIASGPTQSVSVAPSQLALGGGLTQTPQSAFNNALAAQRSMSMSTGTDLRAAQRAALLNVRAAQQQQAQTSGTFIDLLGLEKASSTSNTNLAHSVAQRSIKESLATPSASILRAALLAPPRFTGLPGGGTSPGQTQKDTADSQSNAMLRKYLLQDAHGSGDQPTVSNDATPNAQQQFAMAPATRPLAEFYVRGNQQGAFYDTPDGTVFADATGSPTNFASYQTNASFSTQSLSLSQLQLQSQPVVTSYHHAAENSYGTNSTNNMYSNQQTFLQNQSQALANDAQSAADWSVPMRNGSSNTTYYSTSPISPDFPGGLSQSFGITGPSDCGNQSPLSMNDISMSNTIMNL